MDVKVDNFFRDRWRGMVDDASDPIQDRRKSELWFALYMEHITEDEYDLWSRRFKECPGHDGDPCRKWCAYCGNLDND